jgi:hypothetical protein
MFYTQNLGGWFRTPEAESGGYNDEVGSWTGRSLFASLLEK